MELALVAISLSVIVFGLVSNNSDSNAVAATLVFVTFGLLGNLFGFAKVDLTCLPKSAHIV